MHFNFKITFPYHKNVSTTHIQKKKEKNQYLKIDIRTLSIFTIFIRSVLPRKNISENIRDFI